MKFFSTVISFVFCLTNSALAQIKSLQSKDLPEPKRIDFTPTSFSNRFSLQVAPVLHVHSGDTIRTETIDATGRDKNGVKRQKGGNPLTGPFYIEDSKPGDVLQITLTKVLLNRNYAYTSEAFVSRSMPDSIAGQFKKPHFVKWKLDIENRAASIDSSFTLYENLKDFKVPLKPFLGCIGVAPSNKHNEILSFFQGDFGGNLDFSGIGQAAVLYLPVFHEGAFFYIGDGHAIQGDGEIAGNALETSLDVEFTIKLIKHDERSIKHPRVENASHIMAIGSGKTSDKAIKIATSGLLEWLQEDYHLTVPEATQVMSTSIEYVIAEIADPEVIVVAKIKKDILNNIKKFK